MCLLYTYLVNSKSQGEVQHDQSQISMILTAEELNRLTITECPSKETRVIADVYGMKCSVARCFINNIINAIRKAFKLIVVHGYNHGQAIKDMLAHNFSNNHIKKQYQDTYN